MKLKVIVHAAEEGGYWAEVPALPGCVSQGETVDETLANIREAAEGWLEVAAERVPRDAQAVEVAIWPNGRLRSEELDLEFGPDETGFLRVYTPSGKMFLTHEEEARLREELRAGIQPANS